MSLSTNAVNIALNNMFLTKGQKVTTYENLWGKAMFLALFNGDPQSGGTEVNGAGYSRILIGIQAEASGSSAAVLAMCPFCSSGTYEAKSIENVDTISFDYAEENWGTVTHFGIYGASSTSAPISSQTLVLSGQLSQSVSIGQGYVALFKKRSGSTAGAFKISME